MRIFLDTNVLARAAAPVPGPAREVLLRCTNDPHALLLSTFILAELSRALRYERVRRAHGLDDAGIDRYVADVESAGVMVVVSERGTQPVVSSDPDDDPIVETAVVGHANVICTRDRHLHAPDVVAYCQKYGIAIMDDVALLQELRRDIQSQ